MLLLDLDKTVTKSEKQICQSSNLHRIESFSTTIYLKSDVYLLFSV